jgi:hypothetical protein
MRTVFCSGSVMRDARRIPRIVSQGDLVRLRWSADTVAIRRLLSQQRSEPSAPSFGSQRAFNLCMD